MINRLNLKNFKCFREEEFNFKNLNLLTGINSGGKSSVIQSLLLIKQNFEKIEPETLLKIEKINSSIIGLLFEEISLNNKYVKLGLSNDILNENAQEDKIYLELESDGRTVEIELEINNKRSEKLIAKYNKIENLDFLLKDNFFYLSADRIVPKSTYEYSKEEILRGKIGNKGEYAIHYLAEYNNENLKIKNLKADEAGNLQFRENVSRWMGKISNGIDITAEVNDSKMESTLKYSYGGKSYLPQNIGFGITYTLPILIMLLKAEKGDIIILENPETHLHPAAQSLIAELCCKAAAEGVQLIIETHSDHFLNAVRVAIKKKIVSSEEVQVYYFNKDYEKNKIEIENIVINSDGKIDRWPKGFFDEWDIQLEKLLKL